MDSKATKVVLTRPRGGDRSFDVAHAERILRMGAANGGWTLPEGSPFAFDGASIRLRPRAEADGPEPSDGDARKPKGDRGCDSRRNR